MTAPDISQMFGELIAIWLVGAWRGLGSPAPFVLAEIGPGRGTLMADILRTAGKLDSGFLKALHLCLVETSPSLAAVQMETLARFDLPVRRTERIGNLPRAPLLLVANELFDAVAIRQFAFAGGAWRERRVGLTAAGAFGFIPSAAVPPGAIAHPLAAGEAHDGAILEVSPEREAIADAIARHLAQWGGAAVMIDYGHGASGFGDTLQAIEGHAFADPLGAPGQRDITSHVDFARLAARFEAHRLAVAPPTEQGAFLLRLGLKERAQALARGRPPADQEAIGAAARRLAGGGEGEMGRLFKVLAAASRPLPLPPFPLGPGD